MSFSKIILAVTALLGLLLAGLIGWFVYSIRADVEHKKSDEYITVEKGLAPDSIIDLLSKEGVIADPAIAKIYIRVTGRSARLQAGDYKFKSPISLGDVIDELEKGKLQTKKITIPEGWTRFEIAKRLASNLNSEPPMDEKAVLYLMNDTTKIADIDPKAENLEGYLYPTTYEFPLDATPEQAIERMVSQFKKTWKPEYSQKAAALGRTNHEIVTIASLIENESKFPEERRIVSSVIYNRLSNNMALGIDATNVYIAKLLGRWDGTINKSDIEVNHPYNTRKIAGLPPGPISSASESSIEAALNPASTKYLYYVLNVRKNDGSHNFYESAAEFEKGKAEYQRWLAQERGK
ncbi:MAG: endolytic transglycosylase MltG [Pyrinomonadaceae bacterium]